MRRYVVLLNWTLRHRWLTILFGVIAFGLTIFGAASLPATFQPTVNTNNSQVQVQLPPGVRLADIDRVTRQADAILHQQPEVKDTYQSIGGEEINEAHIYVTLVDSQKRKATSDEFEKRVAPLFQQIPDATRHISIAALRRWS